MPDKNEQARAEEKRQLREHLLQTATALIDDIIDDLFNVVGDVFSVTREAKLEILREVAKLATLPKHAEVAAGIQELAEKVLAGKQLDGK